MTPPVQREIGRGAIDRVLRGAGVDPDRFVRELYPFSAVEAHGDPARLGELFSTRAWDGPRDLVRSSPRGALLTVAMTDSTGRVRQSSVPPMEAGAAFGRGSTVTIEDASLSQPVVDLWRHAVARELGLAPAGCTASIVLANESAVAPVHLDGTEALVIQLRGQRRWRYAPNRQIAYADASYARGEPATPSGDPRSYHTGRLENDRPRMKDAMLEPGSAIFLPRGWWHSAESRGPNVSIVFRLAIPAAYRVLADAVAQRLAQNPVWRRPMPGVGGSRVWRNVAAGILDAILPRLPLDLGLAHGADHVLAPLAGALLRPVTSVELGIRRDPRELTVGRHGEVTRCLPLDDSLVVFAEWLATRRAPFYESDALHAATACSEATVASLLEWAIRAGALESDRPLSLGVA